jgi:hypothetical protein
MKRIVLTCWLLTLPLTSWSGDAGARFGSPSGTNRVSADSAATQQSLPKSDPSAPKPKRKLDADLSGFDISDSKSDKRVAATLGASRATAVPSATLLAPKRAKLYGANALFSWTFTGHHEGYVLLITDEDEAQLVKQQTKESHYLLDASKAKLEPGATYYWRVQVLPNTMASDPLEFVVVSAEERAAIDKAIAAIPTGDAYQSALARARIFVDHRLWFDALGAYDDLIAEYPNRPELYEDRATIYSQLPVTRSQSEADLARAK